MQANSEVIARIHSATRPSTPSHSRGVAVGRKPISSATAITIAVAARLRSTRSEEHTSELQSRGHLVCRLLLEKKNKARNVQMIGKSERTQDHTTQLQS